MNKIVRYLIRLWQRLIRRIPASVTVIINETSCECEDYTEIGVGTQHGPNAPIVLSDRDTFLNTFK